MQKVGLTTRGAGEFTDSESDSDEEKDSIFIEDQYVITEGGSGGSQQTITKSLSIENSSTTVSSQDACDFPTDTIVRKRFYQKKVNNF